MADEPPSTREFGQGLSAQAVKTDPPLTRRALSGYGWFRKLLTGIESVTS